MRKTSYKPIAVAIATVSISGLALVACGETSDLTTTAAPTDGSSVAEAADVNECTDETTINVAFSQLAAEPMEMAVESLTEEFPQLTVNATPSATTDYQELTQQIVSDIAIGNRPDVVMTGLSQLQFWVDTYNPVELNPEALPENYQTQFLGAGTARDGKTYLAPSQISAPVMAVNQTILDEADAGKAEDIKTYDDLLEVAQKVTDHTGESSVAIPPLMLGDWYTQALVQNAGGTFVNEDGSVGFTDETGIEAIDIWSELANRGLEAGIQTSDDARDAFSTGTLPISFITTSQIAHINETAADGFEWAPVRLPNVDGEQGHPLPAGGNGYLVLSDDSCRAAFSQELISDLLEPETVMAASGSRFSYIPVNTVARDELLASDAATPQMSFAWTFENELTQWGGFPGENTAAIIDELEFMGEELQSGADTETTVNEAAEKINPLATGGEQ